MNKDPHRYDDMLDLPRHISLNRRHMTKAERAAQFSPFKALSGYEDEVSDTARQTEEKRLLGEAEEEEINHILHDLQGQDRPLITVTYFIPDEKKEGGQYVTETVCLRRIDMIKNVLVTADKKEISLDDVFSITPAK